MISIRLFLLVLLTLGCREFGGHTPQVMLFTASAAALGVSLGFGLLFKASAISLLSSRSRPAECSARFFRARQRLESMWIVALPAALLATGWGAWLNAFEQSGMPQSIALLGWFLPSGLLIVLLEMTAAQFDEMQQDELSESQLDAAPYLTWVDHWKLRLRLGEMASLLTCVAPIVLITLLVDATSLGFPSVSRPGATICATLGSFALVLWFLPHWLGSWMGVTKLPDNALRQRIGGMFGTLRARGVEPMLLQSEGRWAGAAVVGWMPMFRQLWIGDGLIQQLSERQLDMVVMHELSHIRRHHYLLRTLPVFAAVGGAAATWLLWPADGGQAARSAAAALVASGTLLAGLGTAARACELDADRQACALAERGCEWARREPGAAACELANALTRLMRDVPGAAKATWLHPSLETRLSNLKRYARSQALRA